MMTAIVRTVLSVLLLTAAGGLGGCLAVAAAGATAGGIMYAKGDLEADVTTTPDKLTRAAETALNKLGMRQVKAAVTKVDGQVTARTARDKQVTVKVRQNTDRKSSHISIRVGVFGDEEVSREIFDTILEQL